VFYAQPDPIAYAALTIIGGGLIISVALGSVRGVILSFIAFLGFIFLRIVRTDPSAEGMLLALPITLFIGFIVLILVVPAGYAAQMVRNRRNKQNQ
jgi:uncharacterized membrane protein